MYNNYSIDGIGLHGHVLAPSCTCTYNMYNNIMLVLYIVRCTQSVATYQYIPHRQQQHPKMHQDTEQSSMVSPRERRGEGKREREGRRGMSMNERDSDRERERKSNSIWRMNNSGCRSSNMYAGIKQIHALEYATIHYIAWHTCS